MNASRVNVTSALRLAALVRPRRVAAALAGPGAGTAALPGRRPVPRARRAGTQVADRPGVTRPGTAPASAWLPSAPCTPGACVESMGSLAAIPRAVLRLTVVVAVLLVGIVLIPVVGRLAGMRRDRAIRLWCRTIVRAVGVRVETTGAAPATGGLLLVANHISWLDVPLLAAVRPGRMLAKAEIRQWPVAGALIARSGALFIERDRLRALTTTVARIADTLRDGAAVVVFPEGSTWCGRAQGQFRRAVFQAALEAAVPVQPVRLRYRLDGGAATTAPAFVGSDSLPASVWRVVSARGLVAEVRVQQVLAPGSAPDRRTLARAAETAATHRTCANPEGAHRPAS